MAALRPHRLPSFCFLQHSQQEVNFVNSPYSSAKSLPVACSRHWLCALFLLHYSIIALRELPNNTLAQIMICDGSQFNHLPSSRRGFYRLRHVAVYLISFPYNLRKGHDQRGQPYVIVATCSLFSDSFNNVDNIASNERVICE